MRRLKILGLVFMAAFALSAVASATALAEPLILPEGGEMSFTGEAGQSTLNILGFPLALCQKQTLGGVLEAKKPSGSFHMTLENCKSQLSSSNCTGLGDATGIILILGTYRLVFDKLGANLSEAGVAVLFLLEPVNTSCFEMTGQMLCLIKPINTKTKHFEIVCEGLGGDPVETVYWNEKGEEVNLGLNGLLILGSMGTILTTKLILFGKEIEIKG